jgi:hypothetical protein
MKVIFSEPNMEDVEMDCRDAINRMKVFKRLRWDASIKVGDIVYHHTHKRFSYMDKGFLTPDQQLLMLKMQTYILDSICDQLLPAYGIDWDLTDEGVTIGKYQFSVAPTISIEGIGGRNHGVRFIVIDADGNESMPNWSAKSAVIEAATLEFQHQMKEKANRIQN